MIESSAMSIILWNPCGSKGAMFVAGSLCNNPYFCKALAGEVDACHYVRMLACKSCLASCMELFLKVLSWIFRGTDDRAEKPGMEAGSILT